MLGWSFVFALSLGAVFPLDIAQSEETYKFERMWPTLQQPWFFKIPRDVAVDSDGYVYVLDGDRIYKLNADGQFVSFWKCPMGKSVAVDNSGNVYVINSTPLIQRFTKDGDLILEWGKEGSGDGELLLFKTDAFPFLGNKGGGIAIGRNGNIYIADTYNHRIQVFTPEGRFLDKWGGEGSEPGNFSFPKRIEVDTASYVYVVDSGNQRVQKFTSEGNFVLQWGGEGSEDGEFNFMIENSLSSGGGVALDGENNVYIADPGGNRVQKFTSNGQFIATWSALGEPEESANPGGVAVDQGGNIYVANTSGNVLKLNSSGQFISRWNARSAQEARFDSPRGITMDEDGNLYVVESINSRVQKFRPDGGFITSWSTGLSPLDIAIDGNGNFYIAASMFGKIEKYDSNGSYLTNWASSSPRAIAIDSQNRIYVVRNNIVSKYTSSGALLAQWGQEGSGDGEFWGISGIAIDHEGNTLVADQYNYRIQKFTPAGEFISKWTPGDGLRPTGIDIDHAGNVYITDWVNNHVHKFDPEGVLLAEIGFGEGFEPGRYNSPMNIEIGDDGKVYVADTYNHRIQIFQPFLSGGSPKAIVISGGGSYSGNSLWSATQLCANFAYRTLTYQGFTKETIHYLTSDTDLDLDNNGVSDDVDGDATDANLEHAITSWATDSDTLVIYLVDHGGPNTFRMSGSETLSAAQLDAWLDTLQETMQGRVIVVYDACESGTFLSTLKATSGQDRIIITSTSPGEPAYFVTQGSVSFSSYFWTHIFNGLDIKESFNLANDAMGSPTEFQHPLLDANGNGAGNETEDLDLVQGVHIGNGTVIHGDAPVIGEVSPDQIITGDNSTLLYASGVTDNDGIARVWAVIRPPDYRQGSTDNPVQELPSFDLMPVGGDRYEGEYDGFNIAGSYQIAIYALDRIGNTSIPLLTSVSVESPLTRKAIIVLGGSRTDVNWQALKNNTTLAYEALCFQGYSDDDIYFMSPVTFSTGVDGSPSLSNLSYAVNTRARENTRDLLVYMIGAGDDAGFQIKQSETLLASELDAWLDDFQSVIPGNVTVVYDACQSSGFTRLLTPPSGKDRILIASCTATQAAYSLSNGDVSFSQYFWSRVLNGADIYKAFLHAKNSMRLQCDNQVAQLDDDGNGIGNEKTDGIHSRKYALGCGVLLAGDDPIIGSVSSEQTINGVPRAMVEANNVTSTGTIAKVWGIVTSPGYSLGDPSQSVTDLPAFTLNPAGENKYEGTYNAFFDSGLYQVAIYAKDANGAISPPLITTVYQTRTNPAPILDIRVNGSDGPTSAASGSSVSISLTVASGGNAGRNADWWIAEVAPGNVVNSFNPGAMSFTPGLAITHQGPLFDLNDVSLPTLTDLSLGLHKIFFIVDLEMNGVFDIDQLFYDSVTVVVE